MAYPSLRFNLLKDKSVRFQVGRFLQSMHENKGVVFHMGTSMEEIVGNEEGFVSGIKLKGGDTLDVSEEYFRLVFSCTKQIK